MSDPVIEVCALAKTYHLYDRPHHRLLSWINSHTSYHREAVALKPTSFTVHSGETLGIVGKNGSGKSTLLQLIAGILRPTSGEVRHDGRIAALLELGAGFNPEFTGEENIRLNASLLGLDRAEIDARFAAIVDFSGLSQEQIARPVKTYSSGMQVRLGFAVMTAIDPAILMIDEALAVGDEAFQRKCYAFLRHFTQQGGTLLFVSHSANAVRELCSRAILLDAGELLMDGSPAAVITQYQRLIHAPADQQVAIRQQILTPDISAAERHMADAPLTQQIFAENGARLHQMRLIDEQGATCTLAALGQRLCFEFASDIDVDCLKLRYGMMIKTLNGMHLAGAVSEPQAAVKTGTRQQVRFTFPAIMLPGIYTINCVAEAVRNNEQQTLHRIVDALQFRVLPADSMATGMVDLGIESVVSPC